MRLEAIPRVDVIPYTRRNDRRATSWMPGHLQAGGEIATPKRKVSQTGWHRLSGSGRRTLLWCRAGHSSLTTPTAQFGDDRNMNRIKGPLALCSGAEGGAAVIPTT